VTSIRYDGSFEGFICAAAQTMDGPEPADFLRGESAAAGLFHRTVTVATDRESATAFRERIIREISPGAVGTARMAYHSEDAGVESLLWRYLRLGFQVGRRLEGMKADPRVHPVQRLARRVEREVHRYLGFVRFREVAWSENATCFYAAIEPAHDILAFLAAHFSDRMTDRPWAIHDLQRSQALFGDSGRVTLERGVELADTPGTTREEDICAALWRGYFRRIAIAERANPRLQRQLVPLRCRAHLTEFGGVS